METSAYVTSVIIGLAIFLFVQTIGIFKVLLYRRETLVAKNRFRLFAIRDRFVKLVANGDLEEDDEVYIYCVSFLNFLIKNTQKINFRIFIQAISKVTDRKLPDESNFVNIIESAKQKNNPEVVDAVEDILHAILAILQDNSFSVRAIMYLERKADNQFITNRKRQVTPIISKYTDGYTLYKTYEGIASRYPREYASTGTAA